MLLCVHILLQSYVAASFIKKWSNCLPPVSVLSWWYTLINRITETTLSEFQILGLKEPCDFWSHLLKTLRPPYWEEAQFSQMMVERSYGGEPGLSRQRPQHPLPHLWVRPFGTSQSNLNAEIQLNAEIWVSPSKTSRETVLPSHKIGRSNKLLPV